MAKKYFEQIKAEQMSTEERMRKKAETYNRSRGELDAIDGYCCPICLNRGHTCEIYVGANGCQYETYPECKCMGVRRSIYRMKQSGLEDSIKRCTFDRFDVKAEWQRRMKETAQRFCRDDDGAKAGGWLFIGGAVGSGKTHICTAVSRELLLSGRPVQYMTWPSESTKIKAVINDDEDYCHAINRFKSIDVLYIDDFFKPVKDRDGTTLPPTAADVRLAYEIINHRYIGHMTTILSSERYLSELEDIDMAISSRISERARGYCMTLERVKSMNYRIFGGT